MKTFTLTRRVAFSFGAVILAAFTGCVSHVEPRPQVVYVEPPRPYPEPRVVVQDSYVYYPGYQVYYSSRRGQYIYRDSHAWVTRPVPPRVSVDVLFASPSVRLDFHDSPSLHHSRVVKQYPKSWKPPGPPNHGPGNSNNGKGKKRGDRS